MLNKRSVRFLAAAAAAGAFKTRFASPVLRALLQRADGEPGAKIIDRLTRQGRQIDEEQQQQKAFIDKCTEVVEAAEEAVGAAAAGEANITRINTVAAGAAAAAGGAAAGASPMTAVGAEVAATVRRCKLDPGSKDPCFQPLT